MKKKIEDFNSKIIWTVVMVVVLTVLDAFLLSNLGQPVLPEHRREFLTQMFTGTGGDWVFFVIYNALTVAMGSGMWGVWQLTEEENSTKWGPIWVACLLICLLLIAAV